LKIAFLITVGVSSVVFEYEPLKVNFYIRQYSKIYYLLSYRHLRIWI